MEIGGRSGGSVRETNDHIRGLLAAQGDGNAATGERRRQSSAAGESLGTEDAVPLETVEVVTACLGTGIEHGKHGLALGRPEGVLAIVEQNGVRRSRDERLARNQTAI